MSHFYNGCTLPRIRNECNLKDANLKKVVIHMRVMRFKDRLIGAKFDRYMLAYDRVCVFPSISSSGNEQSFFLE